MQISTKTLAASDINSHLATTTPSNRKFLDTGAFTSFIGAISVISPLDDLKSKVAQRKHDTSVKRAANYSQQLGEDAAFAIDYAIASIARAKVAVLDAIAGHIEVEKAKRTAA